MHPMGIEFQWSPKSPCFLRRETRPWSEALWKLDAERRRWDRDPGTHYNPRGPKHTLSRWLKCETHGGRVLKMQISKDHADRVLKNDLGYTNSILMFLYLYLNHPIIFDQAPTPILCSKAWQFELTHLIWGWVSKLQQNLRVQHVLCQKTFQPQNYASLIGIRFIAFSEFLPMTELCMTLLP